MSIKTTNIESFIYKHYRQKIISDFFLVSKFRNYSHKEYYISNK